MLTKEAGQVETIWDPILPQLLRCLPDDLERLDQLLNLPKVMRRFEQHWGRAKLVGRPSMAMATYVRLMALKHRHGWGYERLLAQVSDSFHLRRFCRIAITDEMPDESTVRKLTRRLGPELVDELTRDVIQLAVKERGFRARAMRCDSTVQEADIRYPTDCGLAADAVKVLARAAGRVRDRIPGLTRKVRNRCRAAGRRIRELNRSLAGRTGDAKQEVQHLTEAVANLAKRSAGEARRLLAEAKHARIPIARSRRRQVDRAIAKLDEVIRLSDKLVEQVRRRFAGEKIADRLVSLFDAQARPIRKGKKAKPNQFGYTVQYTELTPNTKRGARGLLVPPKVAVGNAHEDALLPTTVTEVVALGQRPLEAVFDRGFTTKATLAAMADLGSKVFIAGGSHNGGSRRTRRRLASHRVGCEGRIAHIKREYGADRSRLKGERGAMIWASWTALAYNLDTVARLAVKATDPTT